MFFDLLRVVSLQSCAFGYTEAKLCLDAYLRHKLLCIPQLNAADFVIGVDIQRGAVSGVGGLAELVQCLVVRVNTQRTLSDLHLD